MTDLATIAGLTRPGDSIRERRIELGWTQAELAQHAGVSQADISRIENGRLDARWSTIHRLSSALEAPGTKPKPRQWRPRPLGPETDRKRVDAEGTDRHDRIS